MKKLKGFTIIELLVVIAIIAVLAAIVLVNVTQYLAKSRDAAIRGNLATININAAVYFDEKNTFEGFDTDVLFTSPSAAIDRALNNGTSGNTTILISPNGLEMCFYVTLIDTTVGAPVCRDHTGYNGPLVTGGCTTTAPATYTCVP